MTLVVVPTPIGNLEDITLRALRVLREADLVLCEDTRRTGRLLAHYEIKQDLLAYHEHNEERLATELAERARSENLALVTDAGTPLVSDPGYRLLTTCIEAGVEIEALPGPSALVTALVASGLPADTVVFVGFVPRKGQERTGLFARIGREAATFVLFESPHRLAKTLGDLPLEAPVAVCRELTKLHEEVFRGTAAEAAEHFSEGVKGEIVLVVRGGTAVREPSLEETVEQAKKYVAEGESPSRAAAQAARESGRKKGEVYDRLSRKPGANRARGRVRMYEPDLREAARYFFREPYILTASGGSSGLSGSGFARVEARSGSWCLRRWPDGFQRKHLSFIHRVLLHGRVRSFGGVPELARTGGEDTILELDGALFDVQEWLAGEPLSGRSHFGEPMPNVVYPLRPEILAALAASLARFHGSTAALQSLSPDESMPLSRRLTMNAGEMTAHKEALVANVRARAVGEDRRAALEWLELLPEAVALAGAIIREYPDNARSVSSVCHGDLWAPHVHFDGSAFAGFMDFESLHFGSPAFDLAQLILHFNGWIVRDAVAEAYEEVSPLREEDRVLLPAAAVADLAFEGPWALESLYGDGNPSPAEKGAHGTNLRALLGSLRLVVADLETSRSGRFRII